MPWNYNSSDLILPNYGTRPEHLFQQEGFQYKPMGVLQPLRAMYEKKQNTNKLLPFITMFENATHTQGKKILQTTALQLLLVFYLQGGRGRGSSLLEDVNRTRKMDYVWQGWGNRERGRQKLRWADRIKGITGIVKDLPKRSLPSSQKLELVCSDI